jgi:hypothetical protein
MAQGIWRDPHHGGTTLLGLTNSIQPHRYPFILPTLVVYYVLADGRGRLPITVRVVEVVGEGEEVLAVSSQEVELPDPLAVAEVSVPFHNITFLHAGAYRVQVRCGSVVLLERRLLMSPVRPPVG